MPQALRATALLLALTAMSALSALSASSAFAQVASTPHRVLARYPNGSYLENLQVTPQGEVLFTSYFARAIERWDGQAAGRFATLAVHPVNLLPLPAPSGGYLVLAHGGEFTKGAASLRGSNQLLHLDAQGRVTRTVKAPALVFGNGMAWADARHVLITDSALGKIWRVDMNSGRAETWLASDLLKPVAGELNPGANGLRLSGLRAYVSNSATRKLYAVQLDAQGRAAGGLVEQPAALPGIDDFAIDASGALYIATHRSQVLKFDGRSTTTVLEEDVEGCTSVALAPDGRTLYVLGTGGFFEGKKENATLVAVPVGDGSPQSLSLALNPGRLAYLKQGQGPAVVIVHGIGGHKEDWRGVMAALAQDHTVYAVDMLGFGGSSKDLPEITVASQADALAALLRQEGLKQATLIGNSVGGWVTATFAARHPAQVAQLVLVDAAGFKAMFEAPSPVNFNPASVDEMQNLLRHVLASPWAHTREFAAQALKAQQASGDAAAFETVFKGLYGSARLEELMPLIKAPTLVIWGREDGLFPLGVADLITGSIAGARKTVLDGASHFPQIDQPEAFIGAVKAFLATARP